MIKKTTITIVVCLQVLIASAQLCTNPGQTPVTATLVCGSSAFIQSTVQFCGQTNIPVPCNDGNIYQNVNPNFYRMACYSPGTLGFTIVPADAVADYNWQLFDVTNTNPEDIFTNASLLVACNWSSELGETGASVDGTMLNVCKGSGQPLFSQMPDLVQGHTYLLMVSNTSGTGGTYELSFTGGTASITDNIDPQLAAARINCDATEVTVRFNKELVCNSLALDGSDFSISNGVVITGLDRGDCSSPFGSDSVTLTLSQPLPFGNYTLTIQNGSDGNSVMDVCNRSILIGANIAFSSGPVQPTPLDSVYPVGCKPGFIELIFDKPIRCNSIAADGSDFTISGPQAVTITGIGSSTCNNTLKTRIVRLQLSSPITIGGTYAIQLTTGTDGNTLIDECGLPTAPGSAVTFTAFDTVSAKFTYAPAATCQDNIVAFQHTGSSLNNTLTWSFGTNNSSTISNPVINFNNPGQYTVQLTVSNSICTDVQKVVLNLDNKLKAGFTGPDFACPGDVVQFINTSSGAADLTLWSFGNGNNSSLSTPPPQLYMSTNSGESSYTVQLIAGNTALGCRDTISKIIRVPANCRIEVPTAFTPNNDGRNDFLFPLNAYTVADLDFRVYNRFGELVFLSRNFTGKWDGLFKGKTQPTGVFVWILSYTDPQTKQKIVKKGTSLLLR
ncbi:MAG: gliding motility-associated C-terminal domain-containing protein [Chitinophagales bacterium]|nr:gliding motility-associated C-terminal domain-containing protein [Chitinophagales bacterium]